MMGRCRHFEAIPEDELRMQSQGSTGLNISYHQVFLSLVISVDDFVTLERTLTVGSLTVLLKHVQLMKMPDEWN